METLSDRLKKYIENSPFKKIRAFERYMGWGNSTVNNLKNNINTDKLLDLKDKVPDLNLGWLVSGTGKMIVDNYLDDPLAPRYTQLKNELSHESVLSHIEESEVKYNSTVKNVMDNLNAIQQNKFQEKKGRVVHDDELVDATEIVVPIPGQAGLSSNMFPDELIQEFERRTIRVKPEHRGVFYTIEANGNSMPPAIQPRDWLRCEEISKLFWMNDGFFKEKNIYCIWHNTKGILFKRIVYINGEMFCRSDNEDKTRYQDFPLELDRVSKILIVRKLVDRSF